MCERSNPCFSNIRSVRADDWVYTSNPNTNRSLIVESLRTSLPLVNALTFGAYNTPDFVARSVCMRRGPGGFAASYHVCTMSPPLGRDRVVFCVNVSV